MEKYLDTLKEYSHCFDFSKKDFDFLEKIPIDEMGLMNDDVYKITPLLDQITLYAYGAAFYNESEYNYLSENSKFDSEVHKVMETCFSYVNNLIENGCNHPTVLVYKDMVNSDCLYDSMMNGLVDSLNYIEDEEIREELLDVSCDIDDKINDFIDSSYGVLDEKVRELKTSKEVLKLFGTIGRERGMAELLLFNMCMIVPVNDVWLRVLDGDDVVLTNNFLKMISIIDKSLPYIKYENNGERIEEIFECIKESYILYKGYQGDYYKNSYKEGRLLQKCHKM